MREVLNVKQRRVKVERERREIEKWCTERERERERERVECALLRQIGV